MATKGRNLATWMRNGGRIGPVPLEVRGTNNLQFIINRKTFLGVPGAAARVKLEMDFVQRLLADPRVATVEAGGPTEWTHTLIGSVSFSHKDPPFLTVTHLRTDTGSIDAVLAAPRIPQPRYADQDTRQALALLEAGAIISAFVCVAKSALGSAKRTAQEILNGTRECLNDGGGGKIVDEELCKNFNINCPGGDNAPPVIGGGGGDIGGGNDTPPIIDNDGGMSGTGFNLNQEKVIKWTVVGALVLVGVFVTTQ